jgi:hypothetical protein
MRSSDRERSWEDLNYLRTAKPRKMQIFPLVLCGLVKIWLVAAMAD